MDKLKPKLFSVMKNYTKEQFMKDVVAGIIVAIIALPLSIALAIASGVNPERGLYTAIIAGFFISFLGGSRIQIGGPTAAFVVIIYSIIQEYGFDGLVIATILSGIILIIMGLLRFGSLIKFIPYTITTGFTSGIAIGILAGQIKDFFGLDMGPVPSEFIEKIKVYALNIHSINLSALFIGSISIITLIFWPKITDKIPGSLIAIIVSTLLVKFLKLDVNTIGSVYGELSSDFPSFHIPAMEFKTISRLIQPAFTIAILAGIESLLSCVVSDGMIGSRHRSNMELIAQGFGNIFSGLFGGIPATGAIARTAANAKNGGRTPISGIVHSITLLLILLIFMPFAALIPMPALAAVLIIVAYNMSEWREFIELIKTSPKSDIIVLILTFLLTVVFDLVIAIEVGIVVSAFLFMKRMSEVTEVNGWKYIEDMTDEDDIQDSENIKYKKVPKNTLVYEINGPMFFGAADKFMDITANEKRNKNVVIIRMRSVPAMDATALNTLKKIYKTCKKKGIILLFSHVQEQPMQVMTKAGFTEMVGFDNFLPHTDDALLLAEEIRIKNR
ncbi:SulP family sulfate permease [Mobilisporobacter senegalensis]|uniref:SulP family sulfate permease n=1 Tax=Mobilisporobacter senegalensis TaxID=1329262 RepID=A0A3N1XSS2_9FIRM|nr:sulfate permease [Mobilisporobacter senegalensis]ROR29298.1 SulP family sulfate permease [Mobilisporobacter senegalensis]